MTPWKRRQTELGKFSCSGSTPGLQGSRERWRDFRRGCHFVQVCFPKESLSTSTGEPKLFVHIMNLQTTQHSWGITWVVCNTKKLFVLGRDTSCITKTTPRNFREFSIFHHFSWGSPQTCRRYRRRQNTWIPPPRCWALGRFNCHSRHSRQFGRIVFPWLSCETLKLKLNLLNLYIRIFCISSSGYLCSLNSNKSISFAANNPMKKTRSQLQTDAKKTLLHKQHKNTPPALPLHPFLFKPGLWNFVGHVWAKKNIRTSNLVNETPKRMDESSGN